MRIIAILFSLIIPNGLWAAGELSQSFTLDGQLFLAGTTSPLKDATAEVRVQILDPSKNCLLYEEKQTVNTTNSNGYFSLQIGSSTGAGKRSGTGDPGLTMTQVFQNNVAMTAAHRTGTSCSGLSYAPSANDKRYLRLIVTPTEGTPNTLSPDIDLGSMPSATVAQTLQGYSPSQFLMVGSGDLTQANLASVFATGNAAKLSALLVAPPANYVLKDSTSGLMPLPSGAGTPTGVAAGQMWYDSGSVKYYDGSTVKTLGQSGVGITALTGDVTASGNGTVTATLATVPVAKGGTGTTTGSIAGTGALTFAAGGANENVTITPSGTGSTILNGSVGIGTTSPGQALSVNGTIESTSGGVKFPDGSTQSTAASAAPTGSILTMMTVACPSGYLAANGSAVSRTTYANLFSAISTMYGSGDGSTTFNLPDLRGYFLRGVDGGAGNDPDRTSRTNRGDGTTGDAVGTKQAGQNQSHSHTVTDPGHAHSVYDPGHSHGPPSGTYAYFTYQPSGVADAGIGNGGYWQYNINATGATGAATTGIGIYSNTTGISIQNNGGSEARPKNINVLYCIKN